MILRHITGWWAEFKLSQRPAFRPLIVSENTSVGRMTEKRVICFWS